MLGIAMANLVPATDQPPQEHMRIRQGKLPHLPVTIWPHNCACDVCEEFRILPVGNAGIRCPHRLRADVLIGHAAAPTLHPLLLAPATSGVFSTVSMIRICMAIAAEQVTSVCAAHWPGTTGDCNASTTQSSCTITGSTRHAWAGAEQASHRSA